MLFVFLPDGRYHEVPAWFFALFAAFVLAIIGGFAWLVLWGPRHPQSKVAPAVGLGLGCLLPVVVVFGLVAWNAVAWTTAFFTARGLDSAPRCNGEPIPNCVTYTAGIILAESPPPLHHPSDEWLRLRLADGSIQTPYAPAYNAAGISIGRRVGVLIWQDKVITVISPGGVYLDTYDNPHTILNQTSSFWTIAALFVLILIPGIFRSIVKALRQPSKQARPVAA